MTPLDDRRKYFADFEMKRIEVTGTKARRTTIDRRWVDGIHRTTRIILSNIKHKDKLVTDHMSVIRGEEFTTYLGGTMFRFSALVMPYTTSKGKLSYFLYDPRDIKVINEPPALRIPPPVMLRPLGSRTWSKWCPSDALTKSPSPREMRSSSWQTTSNTTAASLHEKKCGKSWN